MSASLLQLNWSSVTFASTPITHVTSIAFDEAGTLLPFSGDAQIYPTIIANTINNPTVTVTSGDPFTLKGFANGAGGSFVATQNDALNGATTGGGAIIWTLAHGVKQTSTGSGQWGAFGVATMIIDAYSADGTTNPLTVARA